MIAKPEDLSYELASDAYRWISFSPERRARDDQAEYANDVNGLHAELFKRCDTDEQRAVLAAEIERYRLGYLDRYRTILLSRSRTASPMITGPSNFPTHRNAKRLDVEHRRTVEFLEWRQRARVTIARKIADARTDEAKRDDRWDALRRDINGSLATIMGIDRKDPDWRGWSRASFVNSIVGKVERLALAGEAELVSRAMEHVGRYNAEHDKPAISPRHRFWIFGQLAESSTTRHDAVVESEPTVEHEGDGFRIVRNPSADRVQIVFPGKPSEDVRSRLKAEAWKWSPSEGAWQRKLTEAAVYSARRIMGVAS